MIPTLQKLQKDAWRTSGARYNAARRLRRREFFATVSFALMSAFTVAVAFIQRVYAQPSSSADNYLSTFSASLGIFLLTLSLVEWGAKTGAISEALHLNAEKLNAYWRKVAFKISAVQSGQPLSWPEVQALLDEYDILKADCRHNHEPLDDAYFKIHHRAEYPDAPDEKKTWWRWQFSSVWYIAVLWLFLIILAIPLFRSSMWNSNDTLKAVQTTHAQPNSPNAK